VKEKEQKEEYKGKEREPRMTSVGETTGEN